MPEQIEKPEWVKVLEGLIKGEIDVLENKEGTEKL